MPNTTKKKRSTKHDHRGKLLKHIVVSSNLTAINKLIGGFGIGKIVLMKSLN